MALSLWPGRPRPLGATGDGAGVNFALFTEHATAVELCRFDASGTREQRISLRERTDLVWHGYVPGLGSIVARFSLEGQSLQLLRAHRRD